MFITGVNDTGDKQFTSVNNTGDKLIVGVNDTGCPASQVKKT